MRILFVRPVSPQKPPTVIRHEVDVPPPLEVGETSSGPKWAMIGMPLLMVVVMAGMVTMMVKSGRPFNPLTIVFPMLMLGGMGAMMANNAGGKSNKAELLTDRKSSIRTLAIIRENVFSCGLSMHKNRQHYHPEFSTLLGLIGTDRMWEVTPTSEEFTALRYGLGEIKLAARIMVPEAPSGEFLEPVSWVSTLRFLQHQSTVKGMPTALTVAQFPRIRFCGDRDVVLGVVRSMLVRAAVTHGPDNLAIILLTDDTDSTEWSWLKWLPHTQHPYEVDRLGKARMMYTDWSTLTTSLSGEDEGRPSVVDFSRNFVPNREFTSEAYRHVLVLVDSSSQEKRTDSAIVPLADATWLLIEPAADASNDEEGLTMRCDADGGVWRTVPNDPKADPIRVAVADQISITQARSAARQLAKFEVATLLNLNQSTVQVERGRDWATLVRVRDPGALDPIATWSTITHYSDKNRLKIPIGFTPTGDRLNLDIKQVADGGTGPHGMLIGTTGSGKSEFLRNMVLNAAVTHSPDLLNWLLVDFKGGPTFLGMSELPHVSAVITNMEEEAHLVSRMREMVNGEIERRYAVLRAADEKFPRVDIKDIKDYETQRERGADLPPLPSLGIIIDEFAELLREYPDYADLFKRIGRVGRSVGVHLLYASQTMETAGRTSGLEANIGYKIGLKTLTASDSRALLDGSDAAFRLSGTPGHGVLKTTDGTMTVFHSGFTGAPYLPPLSSRETSKSTASTPSANIGPQKFTARSVPLPSNNQVHVEEEKPQHTAEEIEQAPTIFTTVVARLQSGSASEPYRMWLPPLSVKTLGDTAPALHEWTPSTSTDLPELNVPFGLFDDPSHHKQPTWKLDLTNNHLLITGGSQMGKSTAVKTLVSSLALNNHPGRVQMYIIDYAGGGLAPLLDLPHVGAVATRVEPDAINRMLVQTKNLIADRERLFREHRIPTMSAYRELMSQPNSPLLSKDQFGDVFMIIDGWDAAVGAGQILSGRGGEIESLMSGALNYGVHFIFTTSRTVEMRGIEPNINMFVELHSGEMTRLKSSLAKERRPAPGCAITTGSELQALIALPRIDGIADTESVGEGLERLVKMVAAHEFTQQVQKLRTLPTSLLHSELAESVPPVNGDERRRLRIPFGLRESTLRPAYAEMYKEPHLIIYGEPKSGKSELLGTIIDSITRQFPTRFEAEIILLDPRSRHLDKIPDKNLFATVRRDHELEPVINALNDEYNLGTRTVPDDASAEMRKARSWWQGPEIFVIVDDYQIVAPRHSSPPIHHLLPWVRNDSVERGFHFVIARQSEGLMTAGQSDPILRQLSSDRAPAILLSADKYDGAVGEVKFERFGIPGRARYVETTFGRIERIQAAWSGIREDAAAEFDDD